jgi:hypothetical protein
LIHSATNSNKNIAKAHREMQNPILAHNKREKAEKQAHFAAHRIPQCQTVGIGSKAFCVQRRLKKTPLHAPTEQSSRVERVRVVFIYTLESVCAWRERVVSLPWGVRYVTVMTYFLLRRRRDV